MSKYPTYPERKDSGIKWLDKVPTHWDVKRLQYACGINPATPEISEFPPDTRVSFLPMENIGEDGTLSLEERRSIEEVSEGYTRFRSGDVGIAKITPCFENGKGALFDGLEHGIGFGTTELHILRARKRTSPNYLFYLTCSSPFRELGAAHMHGSAGQKRVPEDFVRDFTTGFPPHAEQRAIAAFLDCETATIDRLIRKQERLIELLEEKRTALISHAVTKGLDPDVPMKDSSIGWLTRIPRHWEVVRLKFIARVQSGVAKGRDLESHDTVEVPYLRVANVQQGHVDLSDVATIKIKRGEINRYSLKTGDILMTEGGDFDKLGRGTVWEGQIDPCIHQNHVFVVRASGEVSPRWITTVTQSDYARHYFILRSKQSTNLASISMTNLVELPVVVPPQREMTDILAFIERETARIDALIGEIETMVHRLQEYRTALISAAVSGKIDVRAEVPC